MNYFGKQINERSRPLAKLYELNTNFLVGVFCLVILGPHHRLLWFYLSVCWFNPQNFNQQYFRLQIFYQTETTFKNIFQRIRIKKNIKMDISL